MRRSPGMLKLTPLTLALLTCAGGAWGSGPTSLPTSAPVDFAERLNAAVRSLQLPGAPEIRAYRWAPLVTWHVSFASEAEQELFSQPASSPAQGRAARRYELYREFNARLLKITREQAQQAGELIYPETDVTVEFYGERGRGCEFRGSRCVYLDDPPPGLDLAAARAPQNAPDVQVTIEIIPEKTTWRPRETIQGAVIWRNTGRQRIAMRPCEMPDVAVRYPDGKSPARLPPKLFICGTPLASIPPLVLAPGEHSKMPFSIETDPLDLGGAVVLVDGPYELFVSDLWPRFNIPTECKAVRVEMRTDPDRKLTPRIIFCGAGGNRLAVVRENGAFEAYDLDTGRRVGGGKVADYSPMPSYEHEFLVSPDGAWLALLRRTYAAPPASQIELYALQKDNAPRRTLDLPPGRPSERLGIQAFSPDSQSLLLRSSALCWGIDVRSGNVKWELETPERDWVSNDGAWRVRVTERDLRLWPRESLDKATSLPFETRHQLSLLGRSGVYLTDPNSRVATHVTYAGLQRVDFGKPAAEVIAESPSGALVAVREYDRDAGYGKEPIAFWRLDPPRMLWRLPGKPTRTVLFCGAPDRVIHAKSPGNFDVHWFADTFYVTEAMTGKELKVIHTQPDEPR